MSAARTHCTHS